MIVTLKLTVMQKKKCKAVSLIKEYEFCFMVVTKNPNGTISKESSNTKNITSGSAPNLC
jgi:hypothetical protein